MAYIKRFQELLYDKCNGAMILWHLLLLLLLFFFILLPWSHTCAICVMCECVSVSVPANKSSWHTKRMAEKIKSKENIQKTQREEKNNDSSSSSYTTIWWAKRTQWFSICMLLSLYYCWSCEYISIGLFFELMQANVMIITLKMTSLNSSLMASIVCTFSHVWESVHSYCY